LRGSAASLRGPLDDATAPPLAGLPAV